MDKQYIIKRLNNDTRLDWDEYFALITIGIGFATNFKLGLTLTAVVILLIIFFNSDF